MKKKIFNIVFWIISLMEVIIAIYFTIKGVNIFTMFTGGLEGLVWIFAIYMGIIPIFPLLLIYQLIYIIFWIIFKIKNQ